MDDHFRTALADIVVPDLLDAILYSIVVLDRVLRVVAVSGRLETLTGLGQDEARGLYRDFALRSGIGGRGRVFREVLDSGLARSVEGVSSAATAAACPCSSPSRPCAARATNRSAWSSPSTT